MKRLSILLLASMAVMANAQNKIDFAGRLVIDRLHTVGLDSDGNKHDGLIAPLAAGLDASEQTYNVIVEFADGDFDYGGVAVTELSRRGNMAVVNATAAQMELLAEQAGVVSVSLGFENKSLMYKARPACQVDAVQNGEGVPGGTKYTGNGVVTGLFDTGLDVNHINFINADGLPRTKAVWAYGSGGKVTAYTTPDRVKMFTTEDASETHGTHVLGIMSGCYDGPAKYAVFGGSKGQTPTLVLQDAADSSVPFYGVATNADLAVGCGPLSDGNITAGVENIIKYAESQGQPCVVNLSIGNNIGPHDGTDAFSKYLSLLGEDAIICVAAGNEGDQRISISTTGKTIKTFIVPSSNSSGVIQFWGSDDKPFKVKLIGYDKSKGTEAFSYTLAENLGGKSVKQTQMTGFSSAFTGTVTLSSNISTSNNRYNVSANVNLKGKTESIMAGVVIEPLAGQTVDGFAYNMTFSSESMPGFASGNSEMSINGMACGDNVVVVGSFTTAANWAALSESGDKATAYGFQPAPTVGAISDFSSYGKTFAGKQLPDVCAPGEVIVSSYSKYYVDSAPANEKMGMITGEYTAPKGLLSRNSQWGAMQGTSMATPFVSGVIALWLEADPTLTVADVQKIIKETSVNDMFTLSDKKRFGAGKIDALSGIKAVLGQSGISDVTADGQEAIVTAAGDDSYEVFVAGAKNLTAALYNLSGVRVAEASAEGDTVTLSAESAAAGVYVLRIDSDRNTESRKIVVK